MTVENLGRGGAHEAEEDASNYSFPGGWRTWLGRRGDVARALMYMDVRYEGAFAGSHPEPNLQLTDDPKRIVQVDAASKGGDAFMGLISVLLRWHEEDPVDDLERRRNTVAYLFQGNRNPFVDHPEWVHTVYGVKPTIVTVTPWVNEFHYDNEGEDVGEFVEIAGSAGTDLTGWRIIGYNGAGGKVYHEVPLSGVIPDLQGGYGVLAFDFARMQNGAPDGLALVSPTGEVVELLSYEGVFTATDGPADGMDATPISPEETGSTPVGFSLQVVGRGGERTAFTWAAPAQATRGAVNRSQELVR
jgi:hypothetical protein